MIKGQENLIPLPMRTKEEQRRIRSLGGQSRSPKKLWVIRLNALKKKGLKDEIVQHLTSLMTEQESLTSYFLEQLEASKNQIPRAKYFELLATFNRMQFGEKSSVQTKNTNLNVNMDLSVPDLVKSIKEKQRLQQEQNSTGNTP
jgi:hypothetical protein